MPGACFAKLMVGFIKNVGGCIHHLALRRQIRQMLPQRPREASSYILKSSSLARMSCVRLWRASETQIQAAWLMQDSTMPLIATRTHVNMATMMTSKSTPKGSTGTKSLSNLLKMIPKAIAPMMQTTTRRYSSIHYFEMNLQLLFGRGLGGPSFASSSSTAPSWSIWVKRMFSVRIPPNRRFMVWRVRRNRVVS